VSGREPAGTSRARPRWQVSPIGDAALLLTMADRVDPVLAARAQAIAAAVEIARLKEPAIDRAVPAHASILVLFDPLSIEIERVAEIVESCAAATEAAPVAGTVDPGSDGAPERTIEIAVRYGGADGPDLEEVAVVHGLSPADVVELHAGATYRVLFLGFAPGFAYLGGLPAGLVTPRKATPLPRVPAGSVGIAGEQTGVYPLSMPGGWNLIGRTDAVLFDPQRAEPALLRPGAPVRFVPAR